MAKKKWRLVKIYFTNDGKEAYKDYYYLKSKGLKVKMTDARATKKQVQWYGGLHRKTIWEYR